MSKQKTIKNDSLLDEGLCSIMGSRVVEELPRKRNISGRAEDHQKQIAECRRYQIANAVRWICFLGVMAAFLHWATDKGLVDPVLSMPGICLCTAIGGYQLGCCLSNLRQLPVMKEAVR